VDVTTWSAKRRNLWLVALIPISASLFALCEARSGRLSPTAQELVLVRFEPALLDRITKADPGVLCMRSRGERFGIPVALLTARSTSDEQAKVPQRVVRGLEAALAALPPPIANAFDEHVCSVVVVTGLGATGMTVKLERDPARSVVLLSLENFDRSPDSWLSFKEASFFTDAPGLAFVGEMTGHDDQTRSALLEYLITHELGHALRDALPHDRRLAEFDQICWPRTDAFKDLPLRPYAALAGLIPLHEINLEALYDFIGSSCFPSLTAAMNPGEDFADSLALYSHSVLHGRPWLLQVYRQGEVARRLESCWNGQRCKLKRQAIERFLRRYDHRSEGPPLSSSVR
jgi:hypothetical protein